MFFLGQIQRIYVLMNVNESITIRIMVRGEDGNMTVLTKQGRYMFSIN